jgi:hypothetical protein
MIKLKELENYEQFFELLFEWRGFNLEDPDEKDETGDTICKTVVLESFDSNEKIHIADCKNNDCATALVVLLNEVITKLHRNKKENQHWSDF